MSVTERLTSGKLGLIGMVNECERARRSWVCGLAVFLSLLFEGHSKLHFGAAEKDLYISAMSDARKVEKCFVAGDPG